MGYNGRELGIREPWMQLSKPHFFRKLGPIAVLLSLAVMFCEPGKALDPTLPAEDKPTGKIPRIDTTDIPTKILPGDTVTLIATVADSSTSEPLVGGKVVVSSSKFTLLNASNDKPLSLDSVPADGKVGFRIVSAASGSGSVVIRIISGDYTRSLSFNIGVTEKPIPAKVIETFPNTITPKDTIPLGLLIVDTTAKQNPLGNAEVQVTSQFFTVLSSDGKTVISTDTTAAAGKVTFRLHSSVAGTGTVQVKVTTGAGIVSVTTLTLTVTDAPQTERPRQMIFTALRANLKADGSDSTDLKVVVKDDNNNPMADEIIRFSATGGLVQAEAKTDAWGQAHGTLISERINKAVIVTATLVKTGASVQQKVTFSGVNIQINASKRVIMVDSIVQVNFALKDASDNPIAGDSLQIQVSNSKDGFYPQKLDSMVVVTDTKGEYHTSITSHVEATSIITASALGSFGTQDVKFTSKTLTITSSKSTLSGDGKDVTTLTTTLKNGNGGNINGADLRWTTTFGTFVTTPFTQTSDGKSTINLKAALGSGLATINVEALEGGKLIASGNMTVRILPLAVDKLDLKVTPDNIPVRTGEATLIAQAYDSAGNVMTGVLVGFKMIKGAGGGDEVISPPAAYTENGSATSIFKAGSVISFYRSVRVAAVALDIVGNDTLIIASSDTVPFTISGPPHYVSIGVNVLKGINPDDGTFSLPTAAVVTDVNGNLVADGTPTNFSVRPVMARRAYISWHPINYIPGYYLGDTAYQEYPWGDYNNNGKLDPGEKPSHLIPSNPARGEDIDGNGIIYLPPETFTDLNGNGVWDSVNAEPMVPYYYDTLYRRQVWVDFNKNGIRDTAEPFTDVNKDGRCQCTGTEDSNGVIYESNYFESPYNKPFPGNASIGVDRQIGTVGGKALTKITYVQTDALRVVARVTAEANGIQSFVDVILPVILSGK